MIKKVICYTFSCLTIFFILSNNSLANNLSISLVDNKKKPLENAAVYAVPLTTPTKNIKSTKKVTIRQKNKTYMPYVSIFQTGTNVNFLNEDSIKHHVYSFSKAKRFEIKLYSGKPPKQILFEKPGLVTLGCNIHDNMLAYAYVVGTPHYALSNKQGKAVLSGIPDGQYLLKVEHPQQKNGTAIQTKIKLPAKTTSFSYQLALKPQLMQTHQRKSDYGFFDDGYSD